ncbi:MAG: DUF4836 family protein [Ferruginibacter sp.]|nr:DUF4836 family protein [Cytophagales bacterium]
MRITCLFPRRPTPYLVLLAAFLGLGACRQKQGDVYHIPRESGFVLAVNLQKVALKAVDWRELLTVTLAGSLGGRPSAGWTDRLPNSGINLLGTVYAFGNRPDNRDRSQLTLLLPLRDAARFGVFLREEGGQPAGEEGGLQFFSYDSLVVGWSPTTAFVANRKGSDADALKARLVKLHRLSSDESLPENNEHFDGLRQKPFDGLLWADLPKVRESVPTKPDVSLLQGNYLGGTVVFEQGEIVFDGSLFSDNKSLNAYPEFMAATADTRLIGRIPVPSPVGALALKLKPDAVKRILRDSDQFAVANQGVQMLGMTAEEVLNMLSGDVVMAVVERPAAAMSPQNVPAVYVSLGIRNPESLRRLLNNFKNQEFLVDKGAYLGFSMMPDVSFIRQANQLVITTTPALRRRVLSGKGPRLNAATAATLRNGALSAHLNYPAFVGKDTLPDAPTNFLRSNPLTSRLTSRYVETLKLNARQSSATTADVKLTVVMKNKRQNSLLSLTQLSKQLRTAAAIPADSAAVQ